MTERYVEHCICQVCKEKLINIKPSDFEVRKLRAWDGDKWLYAISIGCPYLNIRWDIKEPQAGRGVKVDEWYLSDYAGLNMTVLEYPSIAEWARRVVARFETRLRLYSKRLGR